MPKTARAVYCSSQSSPRSPPTSHRVSDASASRATISPSHSSSNESLESGRERRRRGKTRMLQRIAQLESQLSEARQVLAARVSQVSAFEERIAHLLAIIAHLTTTADDPSGQTSQRTSAEFFDLFKDHVADAETQTDISVDLTKPDIFIHVPQLGTSYATAHADAAAGLAQPFDADANTTHSQQQTDFKSQNLAFHSELFDDTQQQAWSGKGLATPELFGTEQCTALASPADRLTCAKREDTAVPRLAPDVDHARHRGQAVSSEAMPIGSVVHDSRLAPDDVHSRHREQAVSSEAMPVLADAAADRLHTTSTRLRDSSTDSQDQSYHAWSGKGMATPGSLHTTSARLRNSITDSLDLARPVAAAVKECDLTRISQDQSLASPAFANEDSSTKEFNSQNLACLSGSFVSVSPARLSSPGPSVDFNSQDLASHSELLVDTNSQQVSTSHDARADVCSKDATSEDFKSQDLALQCRPLPSPQVLFVANALTGSVKGPQNGRSALDAPRLAPDDANSRHREHQDQRSALFLGPSEYELQRKADAPAVAASAECISPGPLELPIEFKDMIDSIIRVYSKRKKPSSHHLQSTVQACIRVATMHRVPLSVAGTTYLNGRRRLHMLSMWPYWKVSSGLCS